MGAGFFLGLLDVSVAPMTALRCLLVLVDFGLNPEGPLSGEEGLWPLHAAARHDCLHLVAGLLALRANPHSKNRRGQSALDVARQSRSSDGVVTALRRSATRRPRWQEVVARVDADSLPKLCEAA